MRRILEILYHSIRSVSSEIAKNKLRSFLSLFGVTIGVFCVISVLATVNSLERNIRSELKSYGNNTIYIDKWDYSASGPDYPFWKFAKRPVPRYLEIVPLRERAPSVKNVSFKINTLADVEYNNLVLQKARIYGISSAFHLIQPVDISAGNYLTDMDFNTGSNGIVIGSGIAEKFFGNDQRAIGKDLIIKGKKNTIKGVVKKQGRQLLGGWQFDESIIMPFQYARTIMDERKADPLLLAQGKENVPTALLKDDLRSAMRSIHQLRPGEADNFALNDINDFGTILTSTFRSINLAGWAIGSLAFIVGIFGVANIMFVSVKERTSQIGIKKALGAKKILIVSEFILESAFLCLLGGAAGLFLVFVMSKLVTAYAGFPMFVSLPIMMLALIISIVAGVLSGVWPAIRASSVNPVVAIRS